MPDGSFHVLSVQPEGKKAENFETSGCYFILLKVLSIVVSSMDKTCEET